MKSNELQRFEYEFNEFNVYFVLNEHSHDKIEPFKHVSIENGYLCNG